jgi:glycosyltransferase involved in cell wall biosynthesis
VVPPVSHQEIPGLLVQAHIGALPFPDEAKFQVSSPIKLFEYMGAGLPILATRIACHTDVIDGGEYVFWADDSDMEGLLAALRSAWHSRDQLGSMGHRAAAAARKWTWAESAHKLEAALRHGMRAKEAS